MDKCEECGSCIIAGECSCGFWLPIKDVNESYHIFRKALIAFEKLDNPVLGIDIPEKKVCCIFFQGDPRQCQMVKQFLDKIKELDKPNRPQD